MVVALFVHFPAQSINFFRKVFWLGIVGGVGLSLPVLAGLYATWDSSLSSDRILRGYHVTRMLLLSVQVPLRVKLYHTLCHAAASGCRREAVARLVAMSRSPAWKVNKFFGSVVYLLCLGVILFLCSSGLGLTPHVVSSWFGFTLEPALQDPSGGSRLLHNLCVMHLVIFVMQMAASWWWLHSILAGDGYDAIWGDGISSEEIELHSTRKAYVLDTHMEPQCCSICLVDYTAGVILRVLPCTHTYHTECIDKWLRTKGACPFCQRPLVDSREPVVLEHQQSDRTTSNRIAGNDASAHSDNPKAANDRTTDNDDDPRLRQYQPVRKRATTSPTT